MPEPYTAGTFKTVPTRVHAYTGRGVFMLVDENGQGCWSDPQERVLLPTLDLVDRVLKAHGYVREDMTVVRADGGRTAESDNPPADPATSVEDAPEPAEPEGGDPVAEDDSFLKVESPEAPPVVEAPEPAPVPPPEAPKGKGRR